jgi:hypothetical protein
MVWAPGPRPAAAELFAQVLQLAQSAGCGPDPGPIQAEEKGHGRFLLVEKGLDFLPRCHLQMTLLVTLRRCGSLRKA